MPTPRSFALSGWGISSACEGAQTPTGCRRIDGAGCRTANIFLWPLTFGGNPYAGDISDANETVALFE